MPEWNSMTETPKSARPGAGKPADAPAPSPLVAVERAAQDLRRGLPVMISDADGVATLTIAAEMISDEKLAALRGWTGAESELCLALTHNRAATLKIMPYTPEVVRLSLGGTDRRPRAEDIRDLADPALDLARPLRGPFVARRDEVPASCLAAVRLAKIARILPAAVTVSLPVDWPDAAPPPDFGRVDARDIVGYDTAQATMLTRITSARVPLEGAENSRIVAFRPRDGGIEHLAIVIGDPDPATPVLARLHSECFTGDLLGSLKCDCGQQLRGAIDQIAAEGAGVLLYLAQEGRGIGLINKLRAYALQDQGFDTVEANERLGFEADERVFLPAAEMLRQLGFPKVRLMTNNPDKVEALNQFGIEVTERVPHSFPTNEHNAFYLSTKAKKSGHIL
jgi:GTP cyclohydrolase II